ncbi:MAG: hypothetical protein WDO73_33195 [Ignavibacteriota bacterium]
MAGKTTTWIGITSLFQNLGGFFGVYAFTYLTHYTGRRVAFALSFLMALGMTAFTFWNLHAISDIFWMVPLMGFSQMTLFGATRFICRSYFRHDCAAPAPVSATTWVALWPPSARSRSATSPAASSPDTRSPCDTPASP